jgi:sugar lactone lactonase YvrE
MNPDISEGQTPMKRTFRVTTAVAIAVAGIALVPATPTSAHGKPGSFPTTITLPVGFRPEGITTGPGPFAYLGSLANGSIFKVDLATGEGKTISPGGGPTAPSVGLKSDQRGRLYVAGGSGGNGRVIDTRTGAVLNTYQFATATPTAPTFVNDVVLTPDAAYFTDSRRPVLYKVRIRHGKPAGTFETLTVTGMPVDPAVNNANGIARTPDGRALLVVQSTPGALWRVDPRTGAATKLDIPVESLVNGDGLLLDGRTLYVVQNRLNRITVINLNRSGTAGTVTGTITDPGFDVPTTVAKFGNRLYLPNARFGIPAPETATFTVVAVRR